MKKTICILLAALLLGGCTAARSAAGAPAKAASEDTPALRADNEPGGESGYYGMLYVGEGKKAETDVGSVSAESDVNAVLAQGGSLTLQDAMIEKTGDATGTAASGGGNAAAASVAGGQLAFRNCDVVTDGYGAHGLFATGANTYLTAEDTRVITRGETSAAVFATEAGIVEFKGGSLTVEDASGTSPVLLLGGGAAVSLDGTAVTRGAGAAAEVIGAATSLTLTDTALTGDIELAEGAAFTLTLGAGSTFTGALTGGDMAETKVHLDAGGKWVLTADTTVTVLSDADGAFQNIESNGFSITYDAEHTENAALNRGAFELPGGGFLVPSI